MEYYRLNRDWCGYKAGLVVYVVESRSWLQMGANGRCRHHDKRWIGYPNVDNPRTPLAHICVERAGLQAHLDKFDRYHPPHGTAE